ncbi:hypothetical protein K1719_036432 [Acacia pycnantha]|nr:hypothetical protein K1719_036432 [Acacia pycnantha]
MASIFYWNVRGTCNKGLSRNLRSVLGGSSLDIIALAETKCERVDNFRCLEKLGYDDSAAIPSVGRYDSLVGAWRSSCVTVTVICKNRQYCHLCCSWVGRNLFFLTVVYVVPALPFKEALWRDLQSFASSMDSL